MSVATASMVSAPAGPLLTCTGCRHEFRVPLNLAGRSVACPHCQVMVKVPEFAQATQPEAKDPIVGQVVGGALLERRIGAGGLGLVYAGIQQGTNRKVAVKLLGAKAGADATLVERFRREAHLQASLDHPHIVRAYGAGVERGAHYLVMELVDGPTLSGLVSERIRIPWAEACSLVAQTAQALAVLHDHGIVHRDIKPGNILVGTGRDGRLVAKLADLGLAKEVDEAVEPGLSLTIEGKPLGSPAYMAPEQIQDAKSAGRPADVYGLGASLYQALTGRRPYDGTSPIAIMGAVLKGPPPPVGKVVHDLPAGVVALVEATMARDPASRPTAAQLAEDLDRLAKRAGSSAWRSPTGGFQRIPTESHHRGGVDGQQRPGSSTHQRPGTDPFAKRPGTSSWSRPSGGTAPTAGPIPPTPRHAAPARDSAVWQEPKPALPTWALLTLIVLVALGVLLAAVIAFKP